MPTINVFTWLDGRGWIILAGSADEAIRAQAIGRGSADGGVAYIKLSGDPTSGERVLEDMEDLGAPAGYIVDVLSEDDAAVTTNLGQAGMIVIEPGESVESVRSALVGAANEGIQAAYENGAIVLIEGISAMAFGEWIVQADGDLAAGLEWIQRVLIAPGVTQAAEWAREVLLQNPTLFAVGIGRGAALVLGPDGQVETWGDGQITVALGRNFTTGGTA